MKVYKLFGVMGLSALILWGCGGDTGNQATNAKDTGVTNSTTNDLANKDGSEKVDDQEGLNIGDTGVVEDTLGKYEVKLKTIKLTKHVEGIQLANDVFVLAQVSIKNVGENSFKASDVVSAVEMISPNDGGGGNRAKLASDLDNFQGKGKVAPGKTVEGWLVFDKGKFGHYKMVWNFGFTGTLSNKVTWEFDTSEAK